MKIRIFKSHLTSELEKMIEQFFLDSKVQYVDSKFTTTNGGDSSDWHYVIIFYNVKDKMVY
jgi:hypothetical protein